MKTYEVIIDYESKTYLIEAENEEEAENKAMREHSAYLEEEPIPNYWIGDCTENNEYNLEINKNVNN